MIYNTRNRTDNITDSQEKKTCLNAHFKCSQKPKITELNKMCQDAVQYK